MYRGERIAGGWKGSAGWKKKEIMKELEYRGGGGKNEVSEKGMSDVIENERPIKLKCEE